MLHKARIQTEKECLVSFLIPDLSCIVLSYSWDLSLFCANFVEKHFFMLKFTGNWKFEPNELCDEALSRIHQESVEQSFKERNFTFRYIGTCTDAKLHGCTTKEFLTSIRTEFIAARQREKQSLDDECAARVKQKESPCLI